MELTTALEELEIGYDVPALPGMDESDIQTPCLVVDLDALEKNMRTLGHYAKAHHMQLRCHAKTHKSVDIAKLQQQIGNCSGLCCQKVSEAEVFARAGIKDILVSNQVTHPRMIDRLARLPLLGTRTLCCVDDMDNIQALSQAATRHQTTIECLIEIECGQARCGIDVGPEIITMAQAIIAAPGLTFSGIQAYQGAMQHIQNYQERQQKIEVVVDLVKQAIALLADANIACDIVTGGGTGSYYFETESGVYTELQCGSYIFMDADYQTVHDANHLTISEFDNALFILTSIMSHAKPDLAVCDAGLKVQSVDSGLPRIFGRDDVTYQQCSDEHGVIDDPQGVLKINDTLRLVPGHCDPTCNIHDYYVGVRNGTVETVWPISARGKAF